MEAQDTRDIQVQRRDLIKVTASPFAFSDAHVKMEFPPIFTIDQILLYLLPSNDNSTIVKVFINGHEIDPLLWYKVRPKAGASLEIIVSPQGKVGRIIASIAITVAAAAFAPVAAAALFPTLTGVGLSIATAVLGGVITAVGNLALSAIAPPPSQKLNGLGSSSSPTGQLDSPTYFIQGARNDLRPFGVVPCVLGTHRIVPPLAAQNVIEAQGQDNYVRQLFCWGHGKIEVTDIRIGDTPLSNFSNVNIQNITDGNSSQILSNYSNDFSTQALNVSFETPATSAAFTTASNIDSFTVTLNWPNGLTKFTAQGGRQPHSIGYAIEYAVSGSGSYIRSDFSISENTRSSFSRSHTINVSNGTYDVRVVRVTSASGDPIQADREIMNFSWVQLVSVKNQAPVSVDGYNLSAIRMKATDQLNGVIDTFNGLVSQVIPDYDLATDTWIERATSNPASILRFIWQGEVNARPLIDARVDLDALEEWHTFCDTNGYEYNAVIDYEISVEELAREVASAGRASPTILDGKYSVVVDTYKPVIAQHVTPHNSWGYSVQRIYSEHPHAFKVQFINKDAEYLQDEIIVFDDGYDESNATDYARLELVGVTNADQAYKTAREHIATIRLRPELHSFNMDCENIILNRGDRIKFNHDVILVGLGSGRIKSVTNNGTHVTHIILENEIAMEGDKTYALRTRLNDGTSLSQSLVTSVGVTNTVQVNTPLLIANSPRAGDLFMFGESETESIDLIVKSKIPTADFNAEITAVAYNEAIYQASEGAIPEYNPVITLPSSFKKPLPPVIVSVQTGEEVQVLNQDGSVSTRMVITLRNNNSNNVDVIVKIREAGTDSFFEAQVISKSPDKIVLEDFEEGKIYNLQVYYKRIGGSELGNNLISDAAIQNGITFIGLSEEPTDVTDFDITVRGDAVYLAWTPSPSLDLAGYEIRFQPVITGAAWESAIPLFPYPDKLATSATYPHLTGTYLIKSVDRGGRKSANATLAVTTVGGIRGLNVVQTIAEHTGGWNGDKVATLDDSGTLKLGSDSLMDDWGDVDDIGDWDLGEGSTIASEGIYNFENTYDLGEVQDVVISAALVVSGENIADEIDAWDDIDSRTSWDGANPDEYEVILEVRTTQDDTSGTPTWSPWRKLPAIANFTLRGYQFRLILSATVSDVTPIVSECTVTVDVEDRIESEEDIASGTGGYAVTYPSAFNIGSSPAIAISADNLAQGDYYSITSKSNTGFTIEFFNSSATSVNRTFSYVAKGYGRVS